MAAPVDAKVIGQGMALQLALTVPPALLVNALRGDDLGAQSNLWLVAAFLALAVAPAAAGVLVARRRPDAPLLHATAATTAAWAVLALVSVVRAAASSSQLAPLVATLLTIAPVLVGIGVLGAFFSSAPHPTRGDTMSGADEPAANPTHGGKR